MSEDSIEYEPDFDIEEDLPSNAQDEGINDDPISSVKIFAQTQESALMIGTNSSKQSDIKEAIDAAREYEKENDDQLKPLPPLPIVKLKKEQVRMQPVNMPPVKVAKAQEIQQRTQFHMNQQQQRPQSTKAGARIQKVAPNRTQYANDRSSLIIPKQESAKKWVNAPKPIRHPQTAKQSIQVTRQSVASKGSLNTTKPSTAYQNHQQSRMSAGTAGTGVRSRLQNAIKQSTPSSTSVLPSSTRQTVQPIGHYFPQSSRALGQSQSRKSVQQRPQKYFQQQAQRSRPQSGIKPMQSKVQVSMMSRPAGLGIDQSFDRYGMGRLQGEQSTRSLRASTNKSITQKALESPMMKNQVSKMRISDYYEGHKEQERLAPIDLLDKIINVEEGIYGRDLPFHKGQDLFKGLIDVSKLAEFVQGYGKDPIQAKIERVNRDIQPYIDPFQLHNCDALVPVQTDDQDWDKIMDFFQANPAALLDAIPTPRGDDENHQSMRSSRSTRSLGPENNRFNAQVRNGVRLQSPKVGNQFGKRKFSGIGKSSSRQSLTGGMSQSFQNKRPITPKRQLTEKKDFRISKPSGFQNSNSFSQNTQNMTSYSKGNASHVRAKRQEMEQKHTQQVQQRRQQKQLIKATMQTAVVHKKLLTDLDWKEVPLYQDYIETHQESNSKQPFEMDANLFREDELEYLKNMIKMHQNGKNQGLKQLCEPLLTKGQSTILFILKEVLGVNYGAEYEGLMMTLLECNDLGQKTTGIINKAQSLFKFRDQALNFLKLIQKREQILKDMKGQVMKIESDKELDSERGNKEFRGRIQALGRELEMTTDFLKKEVKKFIVTANRQMTQVKIENFIFDGAEYLKICEKEMKEISEIFDTFDLVDE